MLEVGEHLGICVGNCVGNVHLVTRVHEGVVKAHGPVGALLLRIQVVDFFLVGGGLVSDILAALLQPATLAFIQIPVHLRRPDRWFHPLDKTK